MMMINDDGVNNTKVRIRLVLSPYTYIVCDNSGTS